MKRISFLFLLIVPVLFMMLLLKYKSSLGEYYMGRNYDPSYPYLINSLNLSQLNGYGVGYIDHPGTSVQEIGAAVIYAFHLIRNQDPDIVNDVFNNPELYLNKMFLTFTILNSFSLFLLGVIVLIKLRSIKYALFLQLTPFSFYSTDIYFQLTNISAEPVLILSILLLIMIIISFINSEVREKQSSLKYSILFALICGFGLSAKISFFPLIVIPVLLLKEFKFKACFLALTFLSFCLFIFPAFSLEHSNNFLVWIKDIITHSANHGKGAEDFVNPVNYIKNVVTIFSKSIIFSFTYLLLLITFILQFFQKYKIQIRTNKYFKLLTAVLMAMTIQILIVAKHFETYYMIPAFMLSITGLFTIYSIYLSAIPGFFRHKAIKYSFLIVILGMFFFQLFPVRKQIKYNTRLRNESGNLIDTLEEKYSQLIKIESYETSGKEFALYLGSSYGGTQEKKYYNIIKEKYPGTFYFDKWDNFLYDVWDIDYMRSQLKKTNSIIFIANHGEDIENFMRYLKEFTNKQTATYEKLLSNTNGESIYKINLEPG